MDRQQRVNISRSNRDDLVNTFPIQQLSWEDLLEVDARRIPLLCGSRCAHAPALWSWSDPGGLRHLFTGFQPQPASGSL